MKKYIIPSIMSSILIFLSNQTINAQQKPNRMGGLSPDDPALHQIPTKGPTEEEAADAPPGEFTKIHLRAVNRMRTQLTETIAAAPPGPAGQGNAIFPKLQTLKVGLDQVATTRRFQDLLDLFPLLQECVQSPIAGENEPQFLGDTSRNIRDFGHAMVQIIREYVVDTNGNVTAANIPKLIEFFANYGYFISPNDWEGELWPFDSAGVMIIAPSIVVAYLKTQPWKETEQFLHGDTATEAFARYQASGDGLAMLKTKYAADQASYTAKWNELNAWVAQQRAAAEQK
jgi:hypothetical protein